MSAIMLQHRELPTGPIVIEWEFGYAEPHCHNSGEIIFEGAKRCPQHGDEEFPCLVEWRQPPECEHRELDFADAERPRCLACGVAGKIATERWLKHTAPAARGFASYDEVMLLGDSGDDHSSLTMPADS